MKLIKKGNYGYINQKKKTQSIITVLMLTLCVSVYAIGFYSTGSNANLLTYVSILGCLPMAKFAVSAIMFIKASGCSSKLKEKLDSSNVHPLFYDLYFTSYKKNFQISACSYKKHTFIMLSEDEKISLEEGENHIKDTLKAAGLENYTVKIFTDSDKFIERVTELETLEPDTADNTFLFDNILSISL